MASDSSETTLDLPSLEALASPRFEVHTIRSWERDTSKMYSRRELTVGLELFTCSLLKLDSMGTHVDGLKFAGGSFSLFPEDKLRELIDLAHDHGVYVSTVRFFNTD